MRHEIMSRAPALPASAIAAWQSVASLEVAGITADSREVVPGDVFAALPGGRVDGRTFIADAVRRGAVAILAPQGTEWPPGVPQRPLLLDPEPRRRLAQMAAVMAGPQPQTVVAVTGTNGKTSTVEFLRQIWDTDGAKAASPNPANAEASSSNVPSPNVPSPKAPSPKAACPKAASLGTLGVIAPGFDPGPGLTTPDPVTLAETLAGLARTGVTRAALEASSHGLDQFRLDGVHLAAAGFTNLTRDHLDYHGTEAAYRAAKLRLFEELIPTGSPIAANADMDAATLAALRDIASRRGLDLHTVGEAGTAIRLLRTTPRPDGQILTLEVAGVRREVALPLPGRFQADNALMAACLAEMLGTHDALDRLPGLAGVRGRMELAARLANGATVYVDYAHTPDALERLLTALRPHTAGRLHVVFGAGGDRDRGKRPLMGATVARCADMMVVTDDNPRGEDAAAIRAAVLAGARASGGAAVGIREIGDRAAAIAAAVEQLGPGDVLAVAGKGHEQGQTIAGGVIPFDDVSVVRGLVGPAEAGRDAR